MKKFLIGCLLLLMCAGTSYSQSSQHEGTSQFNVGVGLSDYGLPIYLGVDFSVQRDFTLGFEASYRSYNENWSGNDYNRSIMGFLGNGNYHFNTALNIPSNLDFYIGLNIGFYVWSAPSGYNGTHNSGLGLGAQVGGRYYFSQKVGLNLEVGGGNASAGGKIGLSIRL